MLFLVKNAKYEGELEIPVIKGIKGVPNKLISFIDAMKNSTKDYNQWVHFYIDDFHFIKIWNRPKDFIERLKSDFIINRLECVRLQESSDGQSGKR